MDFFSYLWSLIWSWLGLLAGGAGAAVALYEKVKKQEIHARRYVVILLCFFVFAGFMTWREERTKSDALTKDFEALKKQKPQPDIRITVEDVSLVRPSLSETPRSDSVVVLYLTVRNVGQMPSAFEKYSLTVEPPNRPAFNADVVPIPKGAIIQEPDGASAQFASSDAIYNKTLKPVSPGAIEQGIMAFHVRGVSEPEMVGTTCTLRWRDVTGKAGGTKAPLVRPPHGWRPPFIPGIEGSPLPQVSPTSTPK